MSALLILGALMLCATPAHAQWKWRDGNNRVQYSDLPPPNSVPDAAILQRPQGASRRGAPQFAPPAASGLAAAASLPAPKTVDPELESRRKKAEQEEAAKRKVEEEKNTAVQAAQCSNAKSQLRALEDGLRMGRVNDKGEREILDDKGRAEETKRAREAISNWCK